MSHYANRFTAWSVPQPVIFLVALAAAFFVVAWVPAAHAQTPRPDFKITTASFDGRNLHVEYVNATGVGYPRIRYEVGFQWYDAAGKPVGERHWLPVPEVERGGVAILDTKYRIDLTYRRSGSNYNRRLLDFILQRPNTAEELRVTVDDGDRVPETDESNNVARLRIPLPDLQITGATFRSPNQLELSYRNANPSPIPLPFRIGFTWAEESGTHVNATRWINVVEPRNGATETSVLSRTDASYITPQGRQAGDRLDWYFERRPGNATRLQVTMDDAGTVREQNEQNNLVSVRPFLPDLVVRDVRRDGDRLTFTYGNDGEGYIRDIASRVAFQWLDRAGAPVGDVRWYGFAQMDPKQTFTVNAERFDVQYAVGATGRTTSQRLATYLGARPEGATQLRVAIDDEKKLLEANEANNAVTIAVASDVVEPESKPPPPPPKLPDLTITDATLDTAALRFWMRNQGESSAAPMISLWYEWVNAKGERVSDLRWINVGALGAGSRREGNQLLDFATLDSERGKITLGEFAMAAPSSATHLKLAIDGPNAHAESNEQNNAVLLPKPVFPKPDLAFTDVFIVPNTGKLLIGFQNMGKVAAPEFPWTMAWVDAAGKRLGVSYEGIGLALKPSWRFGISNDDRDLKGKPMTIGKWLVQPKPDGATTLEIVIDPENRIVESDEGNNRRTFDRWSPPEPVKPKFADFRVAEFTIDPVAPRAGERVWFTARVENVGSATTGTPTAAGILVDNDVASRKLVGQFTTAIIPAGKSVMVRWTKENYYGWVAVEGTHTIDVCADRAAVVAEADEANNCTRKTITVPAREAPKAADLIVGSVEVRDGALRIVVRNTGDLFTFPTDIWLMWFGAKGALPSSGAVDLPAIAGGAEAVVTVPFDGKTEASRILRDPPKDATKLRVYADGSRKIEEANEDNNDALLDRAKLPAAPVGNKPPTADAGSDIVERDDDGDGKEDTRFYSRESKDPDGKIVSWVWTVAGREVATGQYPYWWKVPVGTHRVTLTVTDDGGLTATDTVTVTVTGKPAVPPDLVLETLTLDPAAPKPGDDVSFTARVANRGPIAVGQVHTLALDIDLKNDRSINVQLAQPVIKDLPAGESQTYQWKKDPYSTYYHWRAEEGTHRVVVCADKSNSIRESDEKNNCAEVVVTVAAAPPAKPATPDLVVEQVFVLPSKPTANVRVEFATVIRNAGKAAAEESIAYVVLDLGADGEPDATPEPIDVPALKAGESRAVTWPDAEVLPAGKHMIEVCADVGEDVDEAEEENNCKELTFTVDAPARTSLLLLPLRLVLDVFSTPIRAGAAE